MSNSKILQKIQKCGDGSFASLLPVSLGCPGDGAACECPLLSKNSRRLCHAAPGPGEVCGAGGAGCALQEHVVTFSFPSLCCIKTPNRRRGWRRVKGRGVLAGCWGLELVFGGQCKRSGEHLSSAASPNRPAELRRAALPPPSVPPGIIYIIFCDGNFT